MKTIKMSFAPHVDGAGDVFATNTNTGHDRAKTFVETICAGTSGDVFVAEFEGRTGKYRVLSLQASGDTVPMFKPLRPFGVSNCLRFVIGPNDSLYIPSTMCTALQGIPETSEKHLYGLMEYLSGIIIYLCNQVHWALRPEYVIKPLSELEETLARTVTWTVPWSVSSGYGITRFDQYQTESKASIVHTDSTLYVRAVELSKGGCIAYSVFSESAFSAIQEALALHRSALGEPFTFTDTIFSTSVTLCHTAYKTPVALTPVGTGFKCSEDSRTRLCTCFNFRIKETMSPEDFAVESVRHLYDDDPIAQELYKTVPKFYDEIDMKKYTAFVAGVAKNAIRYALFFGESGTGKSTIARAIFHTIGIPYAVLNCSVNIEESDIIGTMIPNPKKASADDPEFIWKDGVLTTAVRYGYGMVLEEINFARPGVLGILNSLLDDAHTLALPTGECVTAHENFRLIATGNLGYEGTNRLNAALVNRFNIIHTFDTPGESETLKIVKQRTGFENTDQLRKLYSAVAVLRKYIKDQSLSGTVSLRQLLNLITCGKYYPDMRTAFKDIVLQGALIEYPEAYAEFVSSVLPSLPLDFKLDKVEV